MGELTPVTTWWFISLSKWVTTLVINGIGGVSPLIIGVITHLLSGMNHQVTTYDPWDDPPGKTTKIQEAVGGRGVQGSSPGADLTKKMVCFWGEKAWVNHEKRRLDMGSYMLILST